MIIDFHTHTFPDAIAERAVSKLAAAANIKNFTNGTYDRLRTVTKESGVDYSVLLPVATSPKQHGTINRVAMEINEKFPETGILSFGGIHPDNTDYREILKTLADNGVKGIKLHPVYQGTYIDDIRYLNIIDCACENGLIVLIHAGYDIGFPGHDEAAVPHIKKVIDTLHPEKFVLAHMGGWNNWDEVEEIIAGTDVWLDTAYTLLPNTAMDGNPRNKPGELQLSKEQFLRIVRKHGADRVLFGTDSPWGFQSEEIKAVKESGLTLSEQTAVLGENAAKLLNL